MKKLIYSIAAASLALTACNDFDEESSKVYPDGPSVAVEVTVESDVQIAYSVTPASGAQSFAYALVEDNGAEYSADDIIDLVSNKTDFGVGVTHNAMTADESSAAGTVTNLDPNGSYVLLAVAYNQYGKTGDVAAKHFQMSDSGKPTLVSVSATDAALVLSFSEPMKADTTGASTGNCSAFSAVLFSANSSNATEAVVKNVVVDGSDIYFYVDGAAPGYYVSIGWADDNAVTDAAGNAYGAVEIGFDEEAGNISAQYTLADEFEFTVELSKTTGTSGVYAEIGEAIFYFTTSEAVYAGTGATSEVVISAESDAVSSTIKTVIQVVDKNTIAFVLPSALVAGQTFTAELSAGALQDAEGNACKAVTLIGEDDAYTAATAFSAAAANLYGTYSVSYYFYTEVSEGQYTLHSETWTIAANGDAENYEYPVLISGITADGTANASTSATSGVYNSLTHILTFGDEEPFGTYQASDDATPADLYLLDYGSKGAEGAHLKFAAPGTATATDYWYLYADSEAIGTLDYIMKATIVRQ